MFKMAKQGTSETDLSGSQTLLAQAIATQLKGAVQTGVTDVEAKKPAISVGAEHAQMVSPKKLAANKENAKKSTGPKSTMGKANSSKNAIKHGLLSRRIMQLNDENAKEFSGLLANLRQVLEPVGVLEDMLVEKITDAYLRMAVAAQHFHDGFLDAIKTGAAGPMNLMRYDTMINRQLSQYMNQLERLQRLRRTREEKHTKTNAYASLHFTEETNGNITI